MNAADHLEAALAALSTAFSELDAAAGHGLDHHSKFAVVECRGDVAYLIRRTKRIALLAGADPTRVGEMGS